MASPKNKQLPTKQWYIGYKGISTALLSTQAYCIVVEIESDDSEQMALKALHCA
jgi:hypothetical protein